MDDKTVEACITDEEIAASAQDEERQIALSGEGNSSEQLGFGFDFTEETRGAANT